MTDYTSVRTNIKYKKHTSNKIVEGPVNKGTPRPAVIIIWKFIRVVSSPRKVCSVSGVRQ